MFAWRQLYREGLLEEKAAGAAGEMLPVKVTTPTVLPTEHARERPPPEGKRSCARGCIEIESPGGFRLEGNWTKLTARARRRQLC